MELVLSRQEVFPSYFLFSLVQGALFGLVVGAFFGSGEGLTSKEKGKIVRGTLLGAATGVIGGVLGFLAGQGVLFLVVQKAFTSYRMQQLVAVPLARIVGWIVLGIFVGAADGLRARSPKRSMVGILGGLLGGLFGGAAIEYLRTFYPDLLYTRLIGLSLFGLLIGLFYSLLERGVSLGVLRVLNGSRRGKEYSFAQNRLSVGSGDRNDIVLRGYTGVEKRHAQFRIRGKEVYLVPADRRGGPASGERKRQSGKSQSEGREAEHGPRVLVNERPVEKERILKYEDVIQLGSAKLLYKTE
jgi:hypothetical protein